ncbi:carbon storage regulator CsrA [Cohnella suwonensis]|uniref:Translational regulator CsrA n=1 Tax=Cohnella suwonensis TaxID=696072 RepID=A0ABW0LXU9_9BACL
MLVLSRKKGQSVIIQDQIEVTVLGVDGEIVKLGISAPKEIQIVRKELISSVKEANREAAEQRLDLQNLSAKLKKMKKNSPEL